MKNFIIGAVVVAALIVAYGLLVPNLQFGASASPDKYFVENFLAGLTVGSSGTELTGYKCASNTDFNAGSIASSSPETGSISLSGVARGDLVLASIATGTTLRIVGHASTTDTVFYTIFQPDGDLSAVDLGTTTLKVCYFK